MARSDSYWGENPQMQRAGYAIDNWSPVEIARRTALVLYPGSILSNEFPQLLERCGPKTYQWIAMHVQLEEEHIWGLGKDIEANVIPGVIHEGLYYPDEKLVGCTLDEIMVEVTEDMDREVKKRSSYVFRQTMPWLALTVIAEGVMLAVVDSPGDRLYCGSILTLLSSVPATYFTIKANYPEARQKHEIMWFRENRQRRLLEDIAKIEAGDALF